MPSTLAANGRATHPINTLQGFITLQHEIKCKHDIEYEHELL